MRVIIIAHNQRSLVKDQIQLLSIYAEIEKKDIIVVDNASEDGLADELASQEEMDYLVCDEGAEGFGTILNYVVKEFQIEEDILILNPRYIALPGSVQEMQQVLYADSRTAAVTPVRINRRVEEKMDVQMAIRYAQEHQKQNRNEQKLGGGMRECTLIKGSMIQEIGVFDEEIFSPDLAIWDFMTRGILKGFVLYECEDAFCYELPETNDDKIMQDKVNVDKEKLKEKWGMNYFNSIPSKVLLSHMNAPKEAPICVLEVGCDCGANLLWIKNQYPNAKLYGLEINPASARIAASFAEVRTGNIEERSMDWGDLRFDYIIFGDVLEHLHDPAGALAYCRDFLAEDGRILLSVPNLMHYSVMRDLIKGNFTYQDMGLLDRTHIHFFTRKELLHMLSETGYQVEELHMALQEEIEDSEESDKELVKKLVELSGGESVEAEFYAYQYVAKVIKAGKR
jgi:SAM-dependent methyltransferase